MLIPMDISPNIHKRKNPFDDVKVYGNYDPWTHL